MKKLIYSSAGLALIAAVFLAFNLFITLALPDVRLDLTQQKLYSISPGTQQILKSIDEPINLYFFWSDKASRDIAPLRLYARRVKEMLQTYESKALGKIRLRIIDPAPFSEDEDRAAKFGLQGLPLGAGEQIYFGLAGTSALDETEVIPFFAPDQEAFLEYELSRLVQSLAQTQKPVVGVLSGLPIEGGFDPMRQAPTPPWYVMENLKQSFHIETIAADTKQIADNISVLLLVHPKNLSEPTLYAIDQFVLKGGKLLAFVDPYSEMERGMPMMAAPQGSDLPSLFKAWGLSMQPGKIIADASYAMTLSMSAGGTVRHAGWLNLPAERLDRDDVSLAGLNNITVASAGILSPLEGATTRFTPLLQSSTEAMPFDVARLALLQDPEEIIRELKPTGEQYSLAARIAGPAQSAFPDGIEGQKDGLKQSDNINLIVVADTDILSDRLWVQVRELFGQRLAQPWADNGSFAANALDNLSGSDALISVRSRGRAARPFTRVEALQREAEADFRAKEQALQERLSETEQHLAELQQQQDPSKVFELSAEQKAALQQFIDQRIELRKDLREVRYQLNANIEALGRWLKLANILLMPLLISLAALLFVLRCRRKGAGEPSIKAA